jgi:hypothetical protein
MSNAVVATRSFLPILLVSLAACATVPPRAGFDDVQRETRERGVGPLAWRRGEPDPALAQRVS